MQPVSPVPENPRRLDGSLWGVATYFNPVSYATKQHNLRTFSEAARRQGLRLLIVELALGQSPFTVDDSMADRVLRVRSGSVLWHKERLINLGVRALPADCDKVAWLDGDVLFENSDWVAQTGELLNRFVAVQPFRQACWLLQGQLSCSLQDASPGIGPGRTLPGMAFAMSRKADRVHALKNYFQHGHSGFGWAARRELLQRHPLFEGLVLGGGDLFIARAFYDAGEHSADPYPPKLAEAMQQWRDPFYSSVQGSVFYTAGNVFHLWHGDNENRSYSSRMRILSECDFNPAEDLRSNPEGCWEWTGGKPELQTRVEEYFQTRKEDGAGPSESLSG